MKNTLLSRVKKLEIQTFAGRGLIIRLGNLRCLPESLIGPRHIVIVTRVRRPNGGEWCEAEERPGQAPPGHDLTPTIFMSEDDANL